MCEDFTTNFGDKRIVSFVTTMHHLTLPFSPGNFLTKINMIVVPTHPTCLNWPTATLLCAPHSDAILVIEAEL
jgi:hypothetical protein